MRIMSASKPPHRKKRPCVRPSPPIHRMAQRDIAPVSPYEKLLQKEQNRKSTWERETPASHIDPEDQQLNLWQRNNIPELLCFKKCAMGKK